MSAVSAPGVPFEPIGPPMVRRVMGLLGLLSTNTEPVPAGTV